MSTRSFLIVIGFLTVLLVGLVWAGLTLWSGGDRKASLVGGPFELVDHMGETVTYDDFSGRFKLIYFGYTFCPDVCPTELTKMSDALDMLGNDAAKIKPLFITVDPERDTVEVMKGFQEHFYPTFSNLTGTVEQVEVAAKAWRIYYRKTEGSSPDDYLVDHTSLVFLMAPNGDFVTHFDFQTSVEDMVAGIRKAIVGS